jgi:hypothetical protein
LAPLARRSPVPSPAAPGRREHKCHHAALADPATFHRRLGAQNEKQFRALSSSVKGIKQLAPRDLARFVTGGIVPFFDGEPRNPAGSPAWT